jgi:AraC-like DNA-binding protein
MNIYSFRTEMMPGTRSFASEATSVGFADETDYLVARSHEPLATSRQVFNVVLNSGHLRAGRNYRVDGRGVSGHELLYCVAGAGYVESGRRRFRLEPFQLAWLSGFSAQRVEIAPWEVLWMRVEGYQIEQAWAALSVEENPIFGGLPHQETRRVFHDVSRLLAHRSSRVDAALNCRLAELLGYLMESGEAAKPPSRREPRNDRPELRAAFERMIAEPERSWRAGDLAKLCGLSERHFFRRFKQATGSSPINWLRRERISFAQTRLLESGSSIKQIADQVGYRDVFFFSRDFKRHTGYCPSEFRRERSSAVDGETARYLLHR